MSNQYEAIVGSDAPLALGIVLYPFMDGLGLCRSPYRPQHELHNPPAFKDARSGADRLQLFPSSPP